MERVRKFRLENEKAQVFDLMDIENYAFLSNPSGLGLEYDIQYYRIDEDYRVNNSYTQQGNITGDLLFSTYENYSNFIYFVESASELRLIYSVPRNNGNYEEFYKIVKLEQISKGEKEKIGILNCSVSFKALTNYRKTDMLVATYGLDDGNELRWDFTWDAYFTNYSNNNIYFNANTTLDVAYTVEMEGELENPRIIAVLENNKEIVLLRHNGVLPKGHKLIKSTKEDDVKLIYIDELGNEKNLFQDIDIKECNFQKIPKNVSYIKVEADTDIYNIKITLYPEWRSV